MYHPLSEDAADQYVELYNRSGSPLHLGGWRLEGALRFTFPSNTLIPADAYLVVATDRARALTNHATRSNPRLASNGADSDESAKAPWTNLEITGTLDLGNNGYAINNLQVILQDAGECLRSEERRVRKERRSP